MKNICIYNASWSTFGGGDKFPCLMAVVMARTCRVRLLVDNSLFTKENIRSYFNLDTEGVEIKTVTRRNVREHLAAADIGVVLSNFIPFGNHAKKNVYLLQIPFVPITLNTIIAKTMRGEVKDAAKDVLRRRLLHDARNADLVLTNSRFVHDFLETNFNIRSNVLYPPIEDFWDKPAKGNVILSVGRIFRGLYNDKRYDILITALKRLYRNLPNTSWQYRIVGSCGTDAASVAYLEELREAARGYPIYFHVNVSHEELKRHYNEATIFWHAAGYGADEDKFPERTEHFGMSTAEAMSAECIPIVINKGGQKEIVVHGKSGFLWNTLDELIKCSMQVMANPEQLVHIQQEVRKRIKDFSYEQFSNRLLSFFQPLLDEDL